MEEERERHTNRKRQSENGAHPSLGRHPSSLRYKYNNLILGGRGALLFSSPINVPRKRRTNIVLFDEVGEFDYIITPLFTLHPKLNYYQPELLF